MRSKLHKIEGANEFCGPAALAAVFGITTDVASSLICKANGKLDKPVRGIRCSELRRTLEHYGVKYKKQTFYAKPPTMAQFTRELDGGVCIVSDNGHCIAIDGDAKVFADSGAYGARDNVRELSDHPRRRVRIVVAYHIIGGTLPTKAPTPIKAPAKRKSRALATFDGLYDIVNHYAINDTGLLDYFDEHVRDLRDAAKMARYEGRLDGHWSADLGSLDEVDECGDELLMTYHRNTYESTTSHLCESLRECDLYNQHTKTIATISLIGNQWERRQAKQLGAAS